MDGWADGLKEGWLDRWIEDGWKMDGRWIEDGWKMDGRWMEDGWKMDGWIVGRNKGRKDGWIGGWIHG